MEKKLYIKFLLTFTFGILVGIFCSTSLKAQNIDSTASTTHLRASHNAYESRLDVKVIPGNKNMKYVKIYDIIGNEVASIDLAGKSGNMSFSLDASQFETGIYLCNLYSDKGIIETRKVYWSK